MKFYPWLALVFCVFFAGGVYASDWPMWRCDAGRTAVSPDNLPSEMNLLWERQYTRREPVWDDPLNRDLMPYDKVFEPVVLGKRMFVPFNDSDKLMALDTETGEEIWAFYTDGPVRFPPVAWKGSVYFTSDDGCLYCVDAASGSLVWKFRGGPSDNKIIGNKRLISTWPARGGPVIRDSTVYFAASIWPFMGTFIYALDAGTGRVVWVNDRTGSRYTYQPHNSPSFAGVAPQGALAATEYGLIVPGGRSVPACFERASGKQLYYHLAAYGKTGGSFVCASGKVFFNHHRDQVCSMYDLEQGYALVPRIGQHPVLTGTTFYISGKKIAAYDARAIQEKSRWWLAGNFWERFLGSARRIRLNPHPSRMEKLDLWLVSFIERIFKGWYDRKSRQWKESLLWEIATEDSLDLIKAGDRLYAAGTGGITAVRLPEGEGGKPEIAWRKKVDGAVHRLVAADNKLFAVTLDGRIMAYGAGKDPTIRIPRRVDQAKVPAQAAQEARAILGRTGAGEGYALFYGAGDGALLEALALSSSLKIAALDPDPALVDKLRRRLDRAGLYGERIAVFQGDISSFQAPPYAASLTVVNDFGPAAGLDDCTAILGKIFYSTRPYGGKVWLKASPEKQGMLLGAARAVSLPGLEVSLAGRDLVLSRNGPLPGAGEWTHQYGDIANTVKSDDSLVKLPLGLLWFGGSSNLDVLPRHAHGPPEQVVGGRLFIEGLDCLSARDVYTGRVLWKAELEGLGNYGVYYNNSYQDTPTSTEYNQEHIPGANIRGANFVAAADRVYVVEGWKARVLDAATGNTLASIPLPRDSGSEEPQWGYIGVYESCLIAGSGLVPFSASYPRGKDVKQRLAQLPPKKRESESAFTDFDNSASKSLVVMDRYTGKVLWSLEAAHGFIHNAIAAGDGKIFCLDKLPPYIQNRLRRRGRTSPGDSRLLALDIHTGRILWEKSEGIFGSWLSYSTEHGILLQSTRPSNDMVRGETGERMAAYRASDGALLWDDSLSYSSVPIIHGEMIITQGRMYSLLTGKPVYQPHPLTGENIPQTWQRNYGCNYPIACENLITFRSAAAGFYDLADNSGTGNLGGFKSGCTSNLVAADGVLNAPDYTRTCSCSYQNQTSLALVHAPEVEVWTFSSLEPGAGPVRRVGINFGAPGDRMAENGTLWLEYPNQGSPSPDIPVRIHGRNTEYFCRHSSCIQGAGLKWVAASGVIGLRSVILTLCEKPGEPRPYTVRLYFAEHETIQPGERVFDVAIDRKGVLKDFDILAEAGAPYRLVVKEFRNIPVSKSLEVAFTPSGASSGRAAPLVCGIEVVAEGW
ncbi:MAG TPA: PQQ-binding-like beta-propeller repeat protein [archaeon]|nr:PQQ-binding-like beta-propeller repeat protein [archaeon]